MLSDPESWPLQLPHIDWSSTPGARRIPAAPGWVGISATPTPYGAAVLDPNGVPVDAQGLLEQLAGHPIKGIVLDADASALAQHLADESGTWVARRVGTRGVPAETGSVSPAPSWHLHTPAGFADDSLEAHDSTVLTSRGKPGAGSLVATRRAEKQLELKVGVVLSTECVNDTGGPDPQRRRPENYGHTIRRVWLDVSDQECDIQPGDAIAVMPTIAFAWPQFFTVGHIRKDPDGKVAAIALYANVGIRFDDAGNFLWRNDGSFIASRKKGDWLEFYDSYPLEYPLPKSPDARVLFISAGGTIVAAMGICDARIEMGHTGGSTDIIWKPKGPNRHFATDEFLNYGVHLANYRFEMTLGEISDYVVAHSAEIFALLKDPNAYVYPIGSQIARDFLTGLERAAEKEGEDWAALVAQLQASGRWHTDTNDPSYDAWNAQIMAAEIASALPDAMPPEPGEADRTAAARLIDAIEAAPHTLQAAEAPAVVACILDGTAALDWLNGEYGKPFSSTRAALEARLLAKNPATLALSKLIERHAGVYALNITRTRTWEAIRLPAEHTSSALSQAELLDIRAVEGNLGYLKWTVELGGGLYEDAEGLAYAAWHLLVTQGYPSALFADLALQDRNGDLIDDTRHAFAVIGIDLGPARRAVAEYRPDREGRFAMPEAWSTSGVAVDWWAGKVEPLQTAVDRYMRTLGRGSGASGATLHIKLRGAA